MDNGIRIIEMRRYKERGRIGRRGQKVYKCREIMSKGGEENE